MAPPRDRRPGFSRRAQYTLFLSYILAIAGALVGAVLLVLSQFNPPAFAALRSAASEITAPVSSGASAVVRGIGAIPETVATYFRVHAENEALRAEVARTHAALIQARIIIRDNRRLRGLLRLREATPETVATARIVSSTASSTRRFGILNAGRWQGVRPGMPVRGPDGLIGRVIETGPNTARVLLAIDPESVIPVQRIGDGLPALAAGRGDGLVDIRSVGTTNAQLKPGDRFVTSGIGGLYTPGVLVARVLKAGSDSAPAAPFAQADIFDFAIVSAPFLPPPPRAAISGATPPAAAPSVTPVEPVPTPTPPGMRP
jgi:rod shape-determining protein MreC